MTEQNGSAAFVRQAEPGRKGEILDAAIAVFAERGYSAGTMRQIAARVGVTEPALYRHFPGKDAIFLALMRLVASRVREEGLQLIAGVRPDTLRPQLLQALADRRRAVTLLQPVLRTVFSAILFNPQFLPEYRETIVEPLRQALTRKAAELDAVFGTTDAEKTRDSRVRALMALVIGYLASSVVLGDEPDEAVADAALRVMGWPVGD